MIALAFYNVVNLEKTEAPGRIKRIANVIAMFTIAQGIIGIIFYFNIDFLDWILDFLHVGISLAIISQASSAATAYDMWEEKEFVQTGKTGELKSGTGP